MNPRQFGKLLFASLALLLLPLACAAHDFDSYWDDYPATGPEKVTVRPGLHGVERIGITLGGDVISKVIHADGTIREITAGGLYQVGLGALYQYPTIPFAVELTLNYHYDSDYDGNDNASFRRVPLEGLLYFNGPGRFRLGAGVRYVYSARATSVHSGVTDYITFRNAHGSIIELGYQVRSYGWVYLRYVKEQYQVESWTTTGTTPPPAASAPYDGSHLGLFISYEY